MAGIRSSFVLLTLLGTHAVGSSAAAAGPVGPGQGITVVAGQATQQSPADEATRRRAEALAREASDRFTEILTDKPGRLPEEGSRAQDSDQVLAPVWEWLARASMYYQDVIIAKLKDPAGEVMFESPPATIAAAPTAPPPAASPPSAIAPPLPIAIVPAEEDADGPSIQLGWTSVVEGVRDWLARANRSYRTEIVKKLVRPAEPETHETTVAVAAPGAEAEPAAETVPPPQTAPSSDDAPPAAAAAAPTKAEMRSDGSEAIAIPERKATVVPGSSQPAETKVAEANAAGQADRKAAADAAEAERRADVEAAAEAEAKRQAEAAAEAKRIAEAKAQAQRNAEAAAEAKRKAEAEAAAKRTSEAASAAKRRAEAAEEAQRKAAAAAEEKRKAEAAAEAKRRADVAAKAKRKAEAEAAAKRTAEAAAKAKRQAIAKAAADAEAARRAKSAAEETEVAQADAPASEEPVTPPVRKEPAPAAAAPEVQSETAVPDMPQRAERKRERTASARYAKPRRAKRHSKRHYKRRRSAHAMPRHRRWARGEARYHRRAVRGWRHRQRECRRCGRRYRRHRSHHGRVYVVRRGDTLSGIARRYYGSGRKYRKIYRANRGRIRNPHLIYARQRIYIP
jgi:nucleoid-associated protein YgaU